MMAIILAGGKGTRLRPLTMTIPKPLLPLDDVPVLEVVIRQLATAGFDRVVLCLNYMARLFAAFVGDGSQWKIQIEYCIESEPLGTAGALRLVPNLEPVFLVVNGDTLTTLDYTRFFGEHQSSGAAATIATTDREVSVDFGVLSADQGGRLLRYEEKPTLRYAVSMGVYALSRSAVSHIPPAGKFDMPELVVRLQESGEKVLCARQNCYWQDIGRFDDYERASADFAYDRRRFLGGEHS